MFTLIRADTLIIDVAFTRDNAPVDLTGCTIYSTFKRNISESDANAVFIKSISDGVIIADATNGLAQIQIDPSDTEDILDEPTLVFDVQLHESTGRVSSVRDSLKIRQDVTKSH